MLAELPIEFQKFSARGAASSAEFWQCSIDLLFFNFNLILGLLGNTASRCAKQYSALDSDLNKCARENDVRETDDEHACGIIHNSGTNRRPCGRQRGYDLHVGDDSRSLGRLFIHPMQALLRKAHFHQVRGACIAKIYV